MGTPKPVPLILGNSYLHPLPRSEAPAFEPAGTPPQHHRLWRLAPPAPGRVLGLHVRDFGFRVLSVQNLELRVKDSRVLQVEGAEFQGFVCRDLGSRAQGSA